MVIIPQGWPRSGLPLSAGFFFPRSQPIAAPCPSPLRPAVAFRAWSPVKRARPAAPGPNVQQGLLRPGLSARRGHGPSSISRPSTGERAARVPSPRRSVASFRLGPGPLRGDRGRQKQKARPSFFFFFVFVQKIRAGESPRGGGSSSARKRIIGLLIQRPNVIAS